MGKSGKQESEANRRGKTRFAVSSDSRLKSVLALCGDSSGSAGAGWKDWSGTLVDVSASGAHVQLSLAAVAFRDNPCRLKLSLGSFKLEIPGTVAHYICDARYSVCGLSFDFSYPGVETAYQRVLAPVMAGATLAPDESGNDASGRHRESFRGIGSTLLIVWRERAGGAISGFDFKSNRYGVELRHVAGDTAGNRAALRFKPAAGAEGGGSPTDSLSLADETEARWQFCLTASNLSAAVPADVRKFFLTVA